MMKMILAVLLCIWIGSCQLLGNEFSVTLENDLLFETDRHYTHGTKFMTVFDDPPAMPFDIWQRDDTRVALALAQYMYTPSDISVEELQEDDRPYGGWLYFELLLLSRDDTWMDVLGFDIGITGDPSLSGETQALIHDIVDSQDPQGWGNQIGAEIGFNLLYQKKYRWRYKEMFDVVPQGGGCLGNIFAYANAGAMCRLGYGIPDNFGSLRMEPTTRNRKKGAYLLGGYEARYVLRNIFLDGNTWEDSHSVDRENFVYDWYYGAGLSFGNFEVVYSSTHRSKEFKGQEEPNAFGSITFSWKY